MSHQSGPLESSRLLLGRAHRHIVDLEAQLAAYRANEPYAVVVEPDTKSDQHILKVKLIKPLPPVLNTIASDAVLNLRAALDQACYGVCVGAGCPGTNTHFPFGDTAAQVNSRSMGGSKDLPKEIFAMAAGFKPYRGGNDALWALNKICNSNKHRVLTAMGAVMANRLSCARVILQGDAWMTMPAWNRDKAEMEIARTRPGGKIDYNLNFTHFVSFADIEPIAGAPVEDVLIHLQQFVGNIIDAIEVEARRIGFIT